MAKGKLSQADIDGVLTAVEGVELVRVVLTVAGSKRRVPQHILRDVDDPRLHVICVKDEDSGEYVPAKRRGDRRYVVRRSDGDWYETTAAEAVQIAQTTNEEPDMADILSKEEIEALLKGVEGDAIYQLMVDREMARKDIAGFYRHVQQLDREALSEEQMLHSTTDLGHHLLGMGKLSDGEFAHLKSESARLVAERRAQATTPAPSDSPAPAIVTSYDLKHPARVNKDQLRTLENLHDNFARLLSSTFSGAMRAVVDVDTAFVDQTTYREFIQSLSNPSCSYQFALGPTSGQAILDIQMPVMFAFVDRIFGGKGSSKGVDARQMSQIEMGVIAKIIKRVVEDLEAMWEPILRVEISDIELETNPEFMQISAADDIVILLAFEVNSTNASGLVSLCYPFYTLESLLPRLGQQTYVRHHRRNEEETIRRSRAALGPAPVELAVEVGKTRVSLGDVDELQVDDVVWCDTRATEPLIMYAGGEPKYYVRPYATESGRMAVKGVGKVPQELQASIRDL
jgi:flagellar motor switch protein FliM